MNRRDQLWKYINRCVVCGSKLKWASSTKPDAKEEEGERYCEQNHARFSMYGGFDVAGGWHISYRLPLAGPIKTR